MDDARGADVLVKASGVGILDDVLEEALLDAADGAVAVFWDVDAPATLARLEAAPDDELRTLVPRYGLVLTYGGGEPVVRRYRELGARECVPVYNALDPDTHHPAARDPRFACDVAFLGNRLPDREARVEEFFLHAAEVAPELTFLLAGAGWEDKPLPPNVRVLGHVSTNEHNAFNSTPLAVLNVLRESMAENGWSPATRVFEAAGAAACIVSDDWRGIDEFLEPGREVLTASSGEDVARLVRELTPARAATIGRAARRRALGEHTYAHRADQVESILSRVPA